VATPGRMPLPPKPTHKNKNADLCEYSRNIGKSFTEKYFSHPPCPGTIPPWYNPGIPTPCLNAEKEKI